MSRRMGNGVTLNNLSVVYITGSFAPRYPAILFVLGGKVRRTLTSPGSTRTRRTSVCPVSL